MIENLILMHYHLKDGGVTQVITREIKALQTLFPSLTIILITGDNHNISFEGVATNEIEELNYLDCLHLSSEEIENIEKSIEKQLIPYLTPKTAIHFHNPTLGKNPLVTALLHRLARAKRVPLLYHCHDFAEDRPHMWQQYETYLSHNEQYSSIEELLYPDTPTTFYLFANRDDMKRASFAHFKEAQTVYVGNPVIVETKEATKEKLAITLQADPQKSWYLYPVRAITRKNIGECILLSLLAPKETEWLITLAPENPEERALYEGWVALCKKLQLPLHFDAARIAPFEKLLFCADTIVTTSIREGFGMAYLEPWLADKPVIGRNISMVTDDFKEAGVIYPHLYEELLTPYERDFGFLAEEEKMVIVEKAAKDPHYCEEITSQNPFLETFFDPISKELIRKNRDVVEEKYSAEAFGRRIMEICDRCNS